MECGTSKNLLKFDCCKDWRIHITTLVHYHITTLAHWHISKLPHRYKSIVSISNYKRSLSVSRSVGYPDHCILHLMYQLRKMRFPFCTVISDQWKVNINMFNDL